MGLSIETYVLAKNYTDSVIDSGAGGVVPNITMTAVQLEAGEQPTVVKGGTNVSPTFELGIPQGEPGVGVPTGGATGQVLAKASNNNYDMVWVDQTGGGGGGDIVLQSIEITTPPSKTSYMAGEVFDNTGMVVTAYYNFSLSQPVTGYTVSPSGGLTGDITEITVNYSEGGIVKSSSYPITVTRNTGTISVNPTSVSLNADNISQTVEIIYNGDGTLNIQNSNPSLIQTSLSENILTVTSLSDTSESVSITISAPQTGTYTSANTILSVDNYITVGIYGVLWDGSASPVWSRTDDAELFSNPSSAVNNGTGSSPFDSIMPWSGMVKVEDEVAGTLVAIPKYWYKWTYLPPTIKLQISNVPQDGFLVSPSHMNRGDGQGERDVVYVGRYHCNSEYKSVTQTLPISNIVRSTAREGISALGAEYWQFDFATYWTIMMLYLVEFANWNTQAMIGLGCQPNNTSFNCGDTDNMGYITGTSVNIDSPGACQYRNIEGIWDNVYDWIDGIYFYFNDSYGILNPSLFSDSSNGVRFAGKNIPGNVYVKGFSFPSTKNFEFALLPNSFSSSATTYICDGSYNASSGNTLCLCGGTGAQGNDFYGGFCLNAYWSDSQTNTNIGCRLIKLPNSST